MRAPPLVCRAIAAPPLPAQRHSSQLMRPSKRQPDELRPVSIERAVSMHAEGSCLIKFGNTHVLCMASLEERIPPWLKGQGRGWVTAEYGMLPRATAERNRREASAGKRSEERRVGK